LQSCLYPSHLFYLKRSSSISHGGKDPNIMGEIKSLGVLRLRTSQKREMLRSG
jgi:hypothetical protein